ncbi:hypothetical protein [Desulfosarcina widdelii]|nr:hypothetical protein [Desulfosarcina widdelii]
MVGIVNASFLPYSLSKDNLPINDLKCAGRTGTVPNEKALTAVTGWNASLPGKKGKNMDNFTAHVKREWKVYVMALWMIAVTGFLFYLNGTIQETRQACAKLISDVDSIESILISTDANVANIKEKVDEMAGKVNSIHQRIRRR